MAALLFQELKSPEVPSYRGGRGGGPAQPHWRKILRLHRCGRDLPLQHPCSPSPSLLVSGILTPPCFKDMLNVFDIEHVSQGPR